jgi:hypothetical protein
VLSLDTRLNGLQVRLRDSMEKFKLNDHTRGDWTLEVVTQVTRPHTQYLNRCVSLRLCASALTHFPAPGL